MLSLLWSMLGFFCCIPILGFQSVWEEEAQNKTTLPYIICCRWNNNPPFFPKCSWLKDPGVKFTHVTLHCLYALWGWNPTHERQPAKHIFQRVLRPTLTSKQNFTTQVFPWSFFDNNSNTGAQIDYRHLHLGFGMTSSGTGVQIDSGDFCSLNLPSNTAASCSMSKAHTAEPGMLQRQRRLIKTLWTDTEWLSVSRLYVPTRLRKEEVTEKRRWGRL